MELKCFYDEVKTFGPMDIKQEENWIKAFGFEKPTYFIYHGEVMDPGTLGNITYGYVGASLYPDFMLYYGGGFANMKLEGLKYVPSILFLPNYGDVPEDIEAIKKGLICGMIGVNVMGKKESWDTGRQIKLAIFAVLALMCEIGVILLWLVRWLDNNTYWNTIKISNKEEMFQFVVEHQEELEQVVWEMENQYGESYTVILDKNDRERWKLDNVNELFKNFSVSNIVINKKVVEIWFAYKPTGYTYWGIYYSKEGGPNKWGEGELIEQEGTYVHMGSYFRYETEKIIDNWYYYQCKTW